MTDYFPITKREFNRLLENLKALKRSFDMEAPITAKDYIKALVETEYYDSMNFNYDKIFNKINKKIKKALSQGYTTIVHEGYFIFAYDDRIINNCIIRRKIKDYYSNLGYYTQLYAKDSYWKIIITAQIPEK